MPKKSKPVRPAIGDIVHITFLDHAQDATDALLFEIFGRLTGITRSAYRVHYWRYVNDVERAADDNRKENEDCYAIVKSAVKEIKVLK